MVGERRDASLGTRQEQRLVEQIEIPIALSNDNDGRGHAHWRSTKRRKDYESLLRLLYFRRKPLSHPVSLDVIRVLAAKQRLWDASSVLRGNWKEIEDAMVAVGFFHDDSPEWITDVRGLQHKPQMRSAKGVTIVRVYV